MFYDLYCSLCTQKNIKPTRAAIEIGLSKGLPSTWKKFGTTPQREQLVKIAEYFGVSVDYLLGKEKNPVIDDDDGSKKDSSNKGKIAADIISQLSPDKQEAALNYLRFLAQQENEKT